MQIHIYSTFWSIFTILRHINVTELLTNHACFVVHKNWNELLQMGVLLNPKYSKCIHFKRNVVLREIFYVRRLSNASLNLSNIRVLRFGHQNLKRKRIYISIRCVSDYF